MSVKHTNDVWNGEYEGVWRERSKSCIRYYGCSTPEERREKCEVLYARMRGRVYVIAARDRRVVYGTARRDQREVKCCMRGEYVIAATGQRGWLHYRRGSATLTVLPFYRRPTVSSDYLASSRPPSLALAAHPEASSSTISLLGRGGAHTARSTYRQSPSFVPRRW